MKEKTSADKTKKAPEALPKKQVWKTIFYVLALMLWVFASIIASQIVVGYIMARTIGAEALTKPVPTAVYSALSYVVAMLMIIMVPALLARKYPKWHNGATSRKALGLHNWPTWTDLGLAPVGYVLYLVLAGELMALFSLFPWFNSGEVQEVGFSYYVLGFDRVVAFVTLVLVAPIAEEIIFRGWLYGKMREALAKQYSNKVSIIVSILLVSLVFGIVHLQWNVGVNVFALSLVLCGLREITGTIHSGIFLHILKNGIAFYLLFVLGMG